MRWIDNLHKQTSKDRQTIVESLRHWQKGEVTDGYYGKKVKS